MRQQVCCHPGVQGTYLVVREYQGVSQNDILSSSGCEDDNFGNVIGGEWLAAPKYPCQSLVWRA